MAQTISQQVLEDFMATLAKNPNVDRKQLMQVFPEFGNDERLLEAAYDYRETRLQNPIADMQTVNSQFPEFFGEPAVPVEQPIQTTEPPQPQQPVQPIEHPIEHPIGSSYWQQPAGFRTVDTSQPVLDPNAGQREVFMMGEPDEQRRQQLEAYERKRAANMPQMEQMWANDEKRFDEIMAEAEAQGAQAAGQVAAEYGNAYQYTGMPGGTRLAVRGEMQAAANKETDPDKIAGQMMDEILARYEKQQEIETKRLIREGLSAKEENANLSEDELNQLVNQTYDKIKSQPIEQLQQEAGVDDSDMAIYAEYVQEQMRNRFMDKYTPQDNWEYFARKVAEGNLLGQAVGAMIETPAQRAYKMQGTQRYASGHNTTWLDLGAEATNIVTDPTMYFFPAAGHAAANFGVRKLATSALTRKGIPYAAQVAERQLLQRGSWNAASRLLGGSLGFMGIDVAHDIAGQMYMPVYNEKTGKYEEGAYDAMQTVGAAGKGAVMGAAFGLGGLMGDAVQRSVGQAYGKTIGAVAGKGTHYAMGTNLMFGSDVMSQIAQGTPIEDIDFGEAYRHAAMTQLFFDLWGGAKQFSANRNIRQKDGSVQHLSFRDAVRLGWNQTKDPYSERFTFTNEELEQLNKYINGGNNQEILLNLNSKGRTGNEDWLNDFYKQLNAVFTDPEVDTQTKYKLAYLLSGEDVRGNVRPIHVGGVEDVGGGKYQVRTYDNSAQTYSTRRFNSIADAERYQAEQKDAVRSNELRWVESVAATYNFAQAYKEWEEMTIAERVNAQKKTKESYPGFSFDEIYRILTTPIDELSPIKAAVKKQMEDYLSKKVEKLDYLNEIRKQIGKQHNIPKETVDLILGQDYTNLNEVQRQVFDDYMARLVQDMPVSKEMRGQRAIEAGGGIPAEPVEPIQETTPLSPAAAEHQRAVNEVTQAVGERTHGNGYIYPVAMPDNAEKTGYIVGEVVPVIDESNPEQLKIENDDIVTVKWSDGTVTQERARDLNLTGAPMMAQQAIDIEVKNQMYGYTQQRIQNGEQPVLMRYKEGILEGFFPTEGGLLEDQDGEQYTPEQLAELGWQETKPVLFVNDTQQIAALDNGDGTYTQVDALGNPIADPMSAEAFREQGFAMVPLEEEQPKSQAPVKAPVVHQALEVQQAPEVQQPEVQEPAAPIVPNIETMSAEELGASAVEYMGDKASAMAYLEAERDKADAEVKRTAKLKVGRFEGIEDFKRQNDQIQAAKRAAIDRYNKLQNAITAVNAYKTQAELQEEAERKARGAAMREQRRQLAEAEAAGDIEAKWQNSKKTVGFAATKTLPNGQKVNGHYILTEAGDVIPSHDPRKNYADSDGYLMENGQNVNDNNYKDPEVQKIAIDIAQNYGGQAVEQMPFLENKAGRVLSGNNRTISGIIAAENNTDQAYLAALAENAQQYGFTPEQLAEYQHPRLQFVVEDELPFTTGTFAMFNQQEKKTKSSVNRAIANSKMVTEAVRDKMLEIMDQYDSLDSFFGSETAAADIVQSLISEGLMTQQEVAGLTENTNTGFKFSQSGREYVTDMLLGTLFDEQTIRMLAGEKTLKQAILRALPSIVENRRLKGYELTESINAAVQILYEARKANEGKSTADAFRLYLRQVDAFNGKVTDRFDGFDIILANRMSAGVEQLRDLLNLYNNSARDEANGQMGFLEPRSSEDIKQDVYEYYTNQQPELATALNGAAEEGAQSQSPVSSGTADAGEARQGLTPGEQALEAAAAAEQRQNSVPERPNSKLLQGMKYTVAEAEDFIGRIVRNILDENGYNDVEIVGTKVIGSRVNGDAREGSDLDAIVEFKGDAREDSLFNLLHEQPIEIDGVTVDINPITEGKSGTIEQFMRRADEYLAEKEAAKAENLQENLQESEKSSTFALSKGQAASKEEYHQQLGEYLDGIADEAHKPTLFDDDTLIDTLISIGADENAIRQAYRVINNGGSIEGFFLNGRVCLNVDKLPNQDIARSKYVHERQHDLTRKDVRRVKEVMDVATEDELKSLLVTFSNTNLYDDYPYAVVADEFISFAMEEAYKAATGEELTKALQEIGVKDELINIIKSINDEQRGNQSLSMARRTPYLGESAENSGAESRRDSETRAEGGLVEEGPGIDQSSVRRTEGRGDGVPAAGEVTPEEKTPKPIGKSTQNHQGEAPQTPTGSEKAAEIEIGGALRQFESVRPEMVKEMESIKNNALNDGTFMQAPNGKPSRLNERQWLQVRTRAFKRWFGDWENDPDDASKVLDENGEPLVVKHGTPYAFNTFDISKQQQNDAGWLGRGFYFFGKNDDYAAGYARGGRVINAFLNIKNPYFATYEDMSRLADVDDKAASDEFTQRLSNEGYDGVYFDANLNGEWVAFNPNQIKSATNNNGDFSEENDDIRFSISNQNNDIFYSNAERAVEGIKQEKATPEQWRAMIEKAGGLKAGEDKWIGLSDWLAQQRPTVTPQEGETRSQFVERAAAENKRFTLSKQDLLDYIREHKIQIEEVEYGGNGDRIEDTPAFKEFQDEYAQIFNEKYRGGGIDGWSNAEREAMEEMTERHGGDDFGMAFYGDGDKLRVGDEAAATFFITQDGSNPPINETRLTYTTQGLENKREIALTVPTIESWNEDDEIHFGDAGEGRAIAWVRFGDATDEQGNKTLVIDEIQSKRHQEGREHGYVDNETAIKYRQLEKEVSKAQLEYHDYRDQLWKKYENQVRTRGEMLDVLTPEEKSKHKELQEKYENLYDRWEEFKKNIPANAIPAAPFEKNWHELAMKRILRFAAENGYDKVAWTTGDQQAARYDLGKRLEAVKVFWHDDTGTYTVYVVDKGNDIDEDVYLLDNNLDDEGLKRTIGKDMYNRVMEQGKQSGWDEGVVLTGEGLRIGGEGMRGFYDDILPRFMQKYGKKWGVQVGEVTMPQLEDGYQTMHAIDINDAMRESVLEGQPMFSISGRGVNGTMKPQDGETRSQYIARVAETVKNMTPRNTTIDDAIRFSITVNHNSPYLLKRADGAFVDPETDERLGFDHRFMGKGEGGQAHGWGSYFSVQDLRDYGTNRHGGDDILWNGKPLKEILENGMWDDAFHNIYMWIEDAEAFRNAIRRVYIDGRIASPRSKRVIELNKQKQRLIDAIDNEEITFPPKHHYTVEIPDNDGTNYFEEDQPLTQEQIDRLRKAAKETGIPKFLETISGFLRFAETNPEEYPFRKFYSDITDFQYGYPRETISNFLKDAGFVGIHYDGRRDGECYVIFDENDAKIVDHIRFAVSGRGKNAEKEQNNLHNSEKSSNFAPKKKLTEQEKAVGYQDMFRKQAQGQFPDGNGWAYSAHFIHFFDKGRIYDSIQIEGNEDLIKETIKHYGTNEDPGTPNRRSKDLWRSQRPSSWNNSLLSERRAGDAGADRLYEGARSDSSRDYQESDRNLQASQGSIGEIDSEEFFDSYIRFSVRKEPAPKKTGIGYKVFYRGKDGKLYPPMVANPNGEDTPVGVWLNADAAPVAGESKTGRPQVKAGGKGTQGGGGQLAYRPGWHLGEIPYALQFNRKDENGEKTLFPKDFVWAEVEYAADNDYQEEAMKEGVNASGKFQHSLAGLKHVPIDGFYRYRTNPNPETDPWIITGAMKVNRVLSNEEVDDIVRAAGREPQRREGDERSWKTVAEIDDDKDIEITEHIRFAVSGGYKTRSSAVTEALVKQANDSFRLMQSALKKVSADLRTINAIRTQQFEYDRKVVDMLLDLYNSLLQENSVWAGYMPDTTRRIATQIVHAIGKKDISAEVNTIMDHMVHAQAKAAQRQWDKLRTTPVDKINISGVVMQGKVALQGQHALKAMNDALDARLSVEQLEDQIAQLMDMEDNATDESLKLQYKGKWIGYTIAAQHLERIQHLVDERNQLDIELQAARSNRAIKQSARQQLVANIQQAMRDNYIAQADAYAQSAKDLAEYVTTQEEQAKDFIHRQDANRDKIRSYAQRDLEGLATNPNRDRTRGNIIRQIWDAFSSPIRDLQSLLRLTGLHAPDGEGYLYNHFMRGWMDGADKERTGIVKASKTLDDKINELTHGKYKTWEEAARKIDDASHKMFTITMLNGLDGKDMPVTEEIPLNAGNALYIYAVNKMNDGRMKLNGMNITEEDVQALADKVREQFGQEILDVVDWVQSEFFSQLRNRYNPTHEALFGAPMDAIENYFPLRINANARQQNEDLSEPDTDAARLLAGTSTGAIKRRTRNSLPLDVRNADFFQEVIRHISQMERWNAFAQWNRDANILFSDINFRNRIKGMKGTIYGEGDKLYNYMKDAFRVAIGTYKPKTDTFSEITLNMAKGVTSAKINFRIFTALKQIASFPAFFTYMQDGVFVQSYLRNWLKPHETMKWAKENLPNFEKRVSKRDMGDMRLMQRSTDWQWNKRILEWSSKYGMFFNVFFDTLTCATGARAVYDSHLADYLKKGYSEEDARNRARQDAEQAFNTSQQSSEGAFMSAVQQDRNLVTAALTVFRTSPIQYTRNFFYHTRNLLRKFGEGKRDEQIAFRMGQYKNDGLNDEQARKAAEKDYNKSLRQDIVGFVVYGALLNILWRLAGQIPYLLLGDDDDKKKKILEDATTGGALVSPITGLIGGSYIESALDGNGLISSMFAPELPFTQDAKRAEQYLENNKYAEFASQALSVLMQSGTGFDPQTASDMVSRIVTTLDSEEELDAATQALRVSQALLSIPQSQYEQMLIDKVVSGETDEDAALEDYIRYQKIHTAPLTWFMRGEESDEKAEENAEKRFNELLTERDKIKNPEDYKE